MVTKKKKASLLQVIQDLHDTGVFKNPKLYVKLMQDLNALLPSNIFHIMGDSDFYQKQFLLFPYKYFGNLTAAQNIYNRKLSQTRFVTEHTFERKIQEIKVSGCQFRQNLKYNFVLLCPSQYDCPIQIRNIPSFLMGR